MRLEYFYRVSLIITPEQMAAHEGVRQALATLERRGVRCSEHDVERQHASYEAQSALIETLKLREFAMRRKVALGRIFGSKRAHFSWLPPQFLLAYQGDVLREVFPCRVGDDEIEPVEFLQCTIADKPWTRRSGAGMEGKTHKLLVSQILQSPHVLEPGLIFSGATCKSPTTMRWGMSILCFRRKTIICCL
jgi:hypothetical protein